MLPKGGDADRFVEIRAAYEELTERRAYWEGRGGGDGSQSDRGGSDFGSSGWGDFGNFWHAEGESQWREVKMRVKLRFLGGTLEMPAEDYMTSPRGDMSQLLHKAFHGKEVRARVSERAFELGVREGVSTDALGTRTQQLACAPTDL